MVTITTHDGQVFTDPSLITIPRNDNTEKFYCFLENYRRRMEETKEPA